MRTSTVSILYKATLFISALFLLTVRVSAQTDISIGTGTTGNNGQEYPCPLQDYYEGSRAQYLFKASELTAAGMGAGMINAIKLNVTNVNGADVSEAVTIKISTTATATLNSATWEPAGATVYGPVDYQAITGVNTFTFTSPFFWNGSDNLLVEMCNGGDSYTQNPTIPWTTGLAFNASHTYRSDNQGSLCGTTSVSNTGDLTTRPNFIFRWQAAAACAGVPTAGTAVATPAAVCLNGSVTLNLNGTSVATGLTYQWQSSSNNTSWTNITGATSPNYTTTQAVTTYYRCQVTCTKTGGGSAFSSSVQVSTPNAISGTFNINKANPTGGTNFNSFNDAYNFIKCGISGNVVFNVTAGSGPYNEQLIMTAVPGASATKTVTFNGNGQTLAYLSTNGSQRATIKLDGTDHITFNNLTIEAKGTSSSNYGFGVQLLNDADSNKINNCIIRVDSTSSSTQYAGIVVSASATSATGTGSAKCDGNVFSNNTITGGYYGLTLVGSNTEANGNNKITGNIFRDFYNYGLYLTGSFNTLIDSNVISRPARTTVAEFYGIYLTSLNTRDNITRNRITNPFGGVPTSTSTFYGIYFSSVDAIPSLENVVSNNLIYKLSGSGTAYGIYNSSSDNVWYYHNTIVMDGPASSSSPSYTTRGFYQTSQGDGINFNNNIVAISRGGQSSKHAIYFNNAGSTIVSNRNIFFIAAATTNAMVGYVGANQATLADWQQASGQDANSLTTNPLFADISSDNYKPLNASINNRGEYVNIPIDITGAARSATTPDIGAYEFTPGPCTAPPTPGTATVASTPVCVNVNVPFGLTGNSVGLSQTFQWQRATALAGPYTNLGSSLTNPDTLIKATTTAYFRVAVTCNGMTGYSEPVLLTVTQALPGDVYTINKNVPAGGKNYTSFAAVKSALECGIAGKVTFNVVAGSGPYNEQLILDSIPGASSVNSVTFNGNGNTIKYSSSSPDERAVIKLRRADYVTIDSLTIDATGTGSYGYGVQLINNADSNIIRNCKIISSLTSTSNSYGGIVVNAEDDGISDNGNTWCDNNIFDHNIITGGYYAVSLVGSDDSPITGNKITNSTIQDFYSDGIHIDGVVNTLVEGNVISRPVRDDGNWSINAIYISGKNDKITISKNRITNLFGGEVGSTTTAYGIYFSSSDAATKHDVINNIFYNLKGEGTLYAIYDYSSDNINFYHNTVSLDDAGSTSSSTAYGVYLSSAGGIKFINNIITVTRGGTGSKYGIYASSMNDLVADHNDYYVQGTGTQNYTGYFNGNNATLADWKTASGQDSSSISMDPVYGDLATGNLAPVVSPLDNTGTPAGVATDILGTTRSTTKPDIGAFEITIPDCTAPPVGGASVATPDSNICMGTTIKLKLSGNSSGGTQTYQWQSAISATSAWANISEVRYVPEFTTELTTRNYFRCRVICGGDTAYSTPVHVLMNPPLVSGDYTIDPAGAGNRNYTSFASAVAALECGIAGWVTFHVAPGTYTEQIRIRRIPGATDTSRVTFLSANRNAASVTLTFNGNNTSNYVLKLDSSSYITYKYITVKSTNSLNGRAIELAGTSSYDSLLNNHITAPATTSNSDGMATIYGDNFRGKYTVIKGNTITNGSRGISLEGPSANERLTGLVIDSNIVNGAYYYGIYTYYSGRLKVNKNTVNMKGSLGSTANGIYLYYADTAYEVIRNKVNISNTTSSTTATGIYIYYSNGTQALPGLVTGNRITAITANAGSLYGLRYSQSDNSRVVNNILSIKNSGSSSYGLYSESVENVNYYNNSVLSAATSSSDNTAAYFGGYGNNNVKIRNNIFAHKGGGRALQVNDLDNLNSDYNTLYTSGATLVQLEGFPDVNFATIHPWRDTANLDLSSIVYKPAFVDDSTLAPDVADPEVWAIHGRGVQVQDNDRDINDKPRPVTLTEGVPDMGAYEFLPTVLPPVLPATPARPAPGITQRFMFGTDTVAKITWGPAVPDSVSIRRHSGVLPPALDTGMNSMYFYTDVDVSGTAAYNYSLQQYYVDSWQGFIKKEKDVRLGRTQSDSKWKIDDSSRVNHVWNVISDTSLQYLDKFTGLQGKSVIPPPRIQPADSSNRGTRFWVAYGHHQLFDGNTQNMVLYLSAEDSANVTVRINGTSWEKQYHIPANSVITSDIIPKTGLSDARLTSEGWFDKGISIESDTPIVAYAHIYGSAASGATMLLPVGTYGYEYYTLSFKQYYTIEASYSDFFVIADQDNTVVEITPSAATLAGKPANVPFRVTLNAGEVYQVLGAKIDYSNGYDLSGSRVRSVQNSDGKCLPMAVFSGSSRVAINCSAGNSSSGDNIFQQIFPSQAWGTKYLTAPTSIDNTPSSLMTNIYRVLVKDSATVVKRNGVVLTGLINKRYYQYESNTADYLESDKPVLVAQYMASEGGCDNTGGNGDPEMIFISPIEQGIKKVGLYRNTEQDITVNYLTLIIPTGGLSSLTIDGDTAFDYTYPHPNKQGYTVVIKRWDAEQAQCTAESDSAFTAITYGLGSVESYGYNAGTLVKNLNFRPAFTNIYSGSNNASTYTCAKTPFRFSILLNGLPTSLTWQFSKVPGLSPSADLVQQAPKPVDSVMISDRKYYKYTVAADYVFAAPGTYYVPIVIRHPDIESCENSLETILPVNVIAAPVVNFDVSYSGCVNDVAQFTGSAVTANGAAINKWKWEFSDSTTAASKDTSKQFKRGGTYNVKLSIVEAAGCIGDTTRQVVVNEPVTAQLVKDTLAVCTGTDVTFTVKDPLPNTTYSWYTTPTGGTAIDTGVSYTIEKIAAPGTYYVGTETAGCKGVARARGVVSVLPLPTVPEVSVDSVGVHAVKYKWKAIPEATAYEVSTDGGVTWKAPSSGEHGLTHTITGLQPVQDVTLIVKAKGCEDKLSQPVPAKTLPDGIFIPNAFSPNGDGLNDVLKVYGYIISEMHMIVFNQWGEKVFESNSQSTGWDGMYKGKVQPSGVYIYVCKLKLMDGTSTERKGAINLIR